MAQTDYIGFQCDYSDNGTLLAKMDVPIKDKRKLPGSGRPKPANGEPELEEVTLLVPLWLPLALNADGEEIVIEGTHFVSCRTKSSIEIFIEKGEFEKRLPKKWPACRDVYNADWASAQQDDSLACIAYDDDGLEIGARGARAWPRAGLIAPTKGSEVTRYYAQAAIWQDIATTSTSAGSSRLWKPASWNEPPLKIYFTPCSAWPSFAQLKAIADEIKRQELKKEANKTSRRLGLTTWLDWDVPGDASVVQNLVLMSTNLLRLYNTYISKEDLQRLVRAQTQDSPDWRRSWPAQSVAQDIQKQILDNLTKANPQHHKLISSGLKQTSTTWISSTKSFGIRIDANKIMGSKSANQLGKEWWGSGEGPKVVAEWLHRSAYSLGPLRGSSDFQSPDNIVFGTFEANSDMTRAETAIRTLRDVSGAEGTLTTTVANDNLPDDDKNRLLYLDPTNGKAEPWEIDKWVGEENYTWVAPNLIYTGTMTLSEHKLPVLWATQFHTFSRYSPLMLEGKMDTRILSEYLRTHFPSSGPSGAKRPRIGTLSSAVASTTSNTPSLATPSDLAADTARVRLSRSVDVFAWPDQAELSNEKQPSPTGDTAEFEDSPGNQDPSTHAAWKSIYEGASHVHLGDVRIEQPHLADDGNDIGDPSISPPATGFMLEGKIKLFGLDSHEVALQSWHGPPPPDVEIGADVPIYQRVQVQSIRPAEFVPLLKGAFFSEFEFQNVDITYQNYEFVKTIPLGWTIAADIRIDKRYGKLYNVLHDVLGISGNGLQVRVLVSLGLGHSWTSRPHVSTFAVQGVIQPHPNDVEKADIAGFRLCDDVVLSRVGVLIYGIGVPSFGLSHKESMQYGFKLFGDMHIKVPGSITPLELDFEIGEFGGVVGLEAAVKGDLWKNSFGVGVDLDMVRLSATFEATSPLKSLQCSLSAHLRAESASALVSGTYTPGGGYSVSAYVQNLGCEGVADLFRHYTGEELSLPNHVDVTIGSAAIEISSDNGLSIVVDKLEFDNYTSANAIVNLSSKGVLVQSSVDKITLPGDLGVNLVSAYMRVSFEKTGSGRSTDVALGGKIELDGVNLPTISAGVHLYKESSAKTLEWTAYGTFTDLGNTTTLGQLFSDLRDTFLENFALQDLMFIAASKDDPTLSQLNPQKFPIKKGIQFSALFGQIDPLNKLLRRSSFPGLLLSASWISGDSFTLDVVLPTNTLIHLGHGITTDPITLSINTKQLLLQIATGVKVPVPKSDVPLDFEAALTIKGEAVKLEGQMNGLWRNPFGISNSVSIGPFLELGLAIDLAIFPETGLPTSFSFAGGLAVGRTEGQVAVQISENPSQQLLEGEIKNFGIQDLVTFTRQITELDIPMPPDFIDFQDVKLYMSSGVTLGTMTYPAGFSFNAALFLFGAQIYASAAVTGGLLKVSGSIDNLAIGPLHITGQKSKQATLDLQIGSTAQQLKVDGAIEFLGAYIGLTLNLEIMPKPTFSFNFTLHFTDLLTFMVDAQMIGDIVDLKVLSGLNFSLHALFEQHLVEHIRDKVVASLEALKHRTDAAIQDAEMKVQAEEKAMLDGINDAKAKLDAAYQSWIEHSNKVHAESQSSIDSYTEQRRILQTSVDNERRAFNAKLKSAEGAVQHANADRAAKLRAAEAEVARQQSKWDEDVASAEAKLEEAKRYMQQRFGSAEADIEAAKHKVDGVQSEIDSTNERISYCENSPWYRFDLKAELIYLGPKVLVLEGYKATADGVLTLAEDIVKGAEYLEAKAAIPAAEGVVAAAGEVGKLALEGAQATLQEVDRDTNALLTEAESALELVQKDGDALFRAAEVALEKLVDTEKAVLDAAKRLVDDLVNSAEWLAYQAASGALSLASHATHGLDVAKKALEVAKKVVDGTITVTEEAVTAALSALNITKVELGATLDTFLGGQGSHFEVSVEGEIVGKPFSLSLKLDMKDTAQLVHDIFHDLRELRAQIAKAGGERQAEVEKAAKLLGSGVERERWARAEKQVLEDQIAALRVHLGSRGASNRKAEEHLESRRRSLRERRDNLVHAYALITDTSSSNLTTTPAEGVPNHLRENSIPFASGQDPPSPPRRFSRLFHFPTSPAPPPSPPPRRHRPPDPLVEARQALEEIGDALAETRTVLVRELADAYELQEEVRQTSAGRDEHVWTLGRMTLPAPDELTRYKPPQLHTTLYNVIHFIRLTSFYLGVKLPFVIGWGASSRIAPPFDDLFIPAGAGQSGTQLDTINEDGEPSDATPIGVGTPWIVAARGLGATADGGWGKYTTPLALHLPSSPRDGSSSGHDPSNLGPAPTTRPHRNPSRSVSSPSGSSAPNSPATSSSKRRPGLLSLTRMSAAARYVAGTAYGSSSQSTPTASRSRTLAFGVPTRTSASSSPAPAPQPRQRSGSVSIHSAAPVVRARVASLAAMPSRGESPMPSEKEWDKDAEPQVQTPIQGFVAALTMLQYNAAYLAWTQGAFNVGTIDAVPGILELLGATVNSEGIGFASHVTSAAQEHALPPPTRSFSLAFPTLLARNIAQIAGAGGLTSAGLGGHDDHGEWDLIEASEEEDGVG